MKHYESSITHKRRIEAGQSVYRDWTAQPTERTDDHWSVVLYDCGECDLVTNGYTIPLIRLWERYDDLETWEVFMDCDGDVFECRNAGAPKHFPNWESLVASHPDWERKLMSLPCE